MIRSDQIRAIFDTYEKYGWVARRVMGSAATIEISIAITENMPATPSDIDAAWFSRPPKHGPVAWEIRFLGEPPVALLESLDETEPDFESKLADIEQRLKQTITNRLDNHPTRLQT